MADQDILQFAWSSFFIAIFLSGLMTIATGGSLLLSYDKGELVKTQLFGEISTSSNSVADISEIDREDMRMGERNPLFFDIIFGVLNIITFLGKIIDFLFTIMANYLLLSVWLIDKAHAPTFIASLLILTWQFWQMYYIMKFIFKDRFAQYGGYRNG